MTYDPDIYRAAKLSFGPRPSRPTRSEIVIGQTPFPLILLDRPSQRRLPMARDPRPDAYRHIAQHLRDEALVLPQPDAKAQKHELARQYDRVAAIIEEYDNKPHWDSKISD
jgi:hypothetical protein